MSHDQVTVNIDGCQEALTQLQPLLTQATELYAEMHPADQKQFAQQMAHLRGDLRTQVLILQAILDRTQDLKAGREKRQHESKE